MKIRIYPKSLLETMWQQDKLLFTPEAEQPPLCLRCGQPLDCRLVINALSRYADVHICEACGIVLSAFVSALIGLFVGKLSDGMMVGVVYIKIVMIVFMAVPILNYLVGAGNKALSYICYLIPSSATFEGIMDLANGTASTATKDIVILALHCVLWFLLYLLLSKQQKKHI